VYRKEGTERKVQKGRYRMEGTERGVYRMKCTEMRVQDKVYRKGRYRMEYCP
jgi:hypothetical protein